MYIFFPLSSLTEELEEGKGTEAMTPDSILSAHRVEILPLCLHLHCTGRQTKFSRLMKPKSKGKQNHFKALICNESQ